MIFSKINELVFIHNPKVGGTSMRKALQHLHDSEIQYWHQSWHGGEQRVVDLAHLTADQWYDDEVVGHWTFGFVRDPYTRFWSAMNEFMRRHSDSIDITLENMSLILTSASIRYDWRFIHFCPQHAFFYHGNDCFADYIGRYETLDRDWATAAALSGNLFSPTLPETKERQVVTDRFDPAWKTEPKILTLINRLYHRDFLLFGYEMQGHLGIKDTHADRVEVIHNPLVVPRFRGQELGALSFTAGERIALEQNRAAIHHQS